MLTTVSLMRCCLALLVTTALLLAAGVCPALAQPADSLTLLGVQEEPFLLYRYQLANGLRIWYQPRPDSTSVTLLLAVDTGLNNETPANNGISHFTEHLLFAGSQRWNEQEIKEVITRLGGQWNGYTSSERTAYYAKVEPQHFVTALDWLVELVMRPAFTEATVEKEREVVFAEGWGQESRVLEWLYAQGFGYDLDRALRTRLFPGSPFSLSILGDQDSLNAIDLAAVQRYHADHYRPDNMVLVVVGNITQAELAAASEQYLAPIPRPDSPLSTPPSLEIAMNGPVHAVVRGPFPTDQVRIAGGFSTTGSTGPDYWALELLAEYLSQRLERQVRYERGLVYSVWADNVVYADGGYLAIRTDGERRHRDQIVDLIAHELDALQTQRIDAADVALARIARTGHQALALEENLMRAEYLAAWATVLPADAPAPDFRSALSSVSDADLARVAATYTVPERRFLAEHLPIVTGAHLAWLIGGVAAVAAVGGGAVAWRRRKARMMDDAQVDTPRIALGRFPDRV